MHARPVSFCEINLTSLINRFSCQLARPTVLTPPWNEPNWFSLHQFIKPDGPTLCGPA
jgi:hypothetical protein